MKALISSSESLEKDRDATVHDISDLALFYLAVGQFL